MRDPTVFTNIELRRESDDTLPNAVGGEIKEFTAGGTLLVGDAVFLSAADTVNKSATAADYAGFVGYVVAGATQGYQTPDNFTGTPVGTAASTVGQRVLVQISGVARAIVGASAVTAATHHSVVPSGATAGRIIPGTTAGQMIGTPTNTQATAGSEVKVLIRHR